MNRSHSLPFVAMLMLFAPGFSQTPQPPLAATPKPAAQDSPKASPEDAPDPATLKAMRSRVFEIKYCSPLMLSIAIRPLGSGVKGSQVTSMDRGGINAISVRDFPENLTAMEEAIQRLDVPKAAQEFPDVELHIHVLFASKQPSTESGLPEELREVVKSLKGTLAYRSYALATSFVQRCDTKGHTIQGRGSIESADAGFSNAKDPFRLDLQWEASNGLELEARQSAAPSILIRKFQFFVTERRPTSSETVAKIETGVSLKEGEQVVVGTSVVKERGLIVVITARRVA